MLEPHLEALPGAEAALLEARELFPMHQVRLLGGLGRRCGRGAAHTLPLPSALAFDFGASGNFESASPAMSVCASLPAPPQAAKASRSRVRLVGTEHPGEDFQRALAEGARAARCGLCQGWVSQPDAMASQTAAAICMPLPEQSGAACRPLPRRPTLRAAAPRWPLPPQARWSAASMSWRQWSWTSSPAA